jgi:hypothetical protein
MLHEAVEELGPASAEASVIRLARDPPRAERGGANRARDRVAQVVAGA